MNPVVIEIRTEEPSMENFFRGILPEILPDDYLLDVNCFIRPHQGKSDLKRSIPRKMRSYSKFGYPIKVLVVQDQDSNQCLQLKEELTMLCTSEPKIPFLIRIACKELENWCLGDLNAIEKVYPESDASKFINKAKYRIPDRLFGSHEMERMAFSFSKSHASGEIPKYLNISANKSVSFIHFVSGVKKILDI